MKKNYKNDKNCKYSKNYLDNFLSISYRFIATILILNGGKKVDGIGKGVGIDGIKI
ncbi:MAG: hypothetical protein QXU98_07040 [Candidatus Parvarchaeota archaeon]